MDVDESVAILRNAVAVHRPRKVFALFSGGHDSLTMTHVAMSSGLVDAVVHIATGIGIPQTFGFMQQTCHDQGWPLLVYRPPLDTETGVIGAEYRKLVLRWGFPGPGAHHIPYRALKKRAVERLVRDHKRARNDRIMLVTGVRKQESKRRMGHVTESYKNGAQVWVAPLIDWSADDCAAYIERHGLRRNVVSDLLHISGECLCGAFARKGEFEEIRAWYPEVARRIRALEAEAQLAGVHCQWGKREPRYYGQKRRGQMELPFMPLCTGCIAQESA